jgi:hypothetical protein
MAMRWKRNPSPSGLAGIASGHPGFCLSENGTRFATVYPIKRPGQSKENRPWYFVAGWDSGIPKKNTVDEPVGSESEAKAAAMAYVKKCLAEAKKNPAP